MLKMIFIATVMFALPAWAENGEQYVVSTFKDADSPIAAGTGQELRISGIDAPELTQPCSKDGTTWFAGQEAANAVRQIFEHQTVVCYDTGERSYKRPVVRCQTTEGRSKDVAEIIVRAGWAFDYPRYSSGSYKSAEASARSEMAGIHQGKCANPWDFRHNGWK